MAINLMDLVKTAINTSGVADQIGSAVGLEKSKTNSAIEAAIPVLLGGLMKKASTPTGASELSNIFKKQDAEPSILDNLGSLVSGGANSKLLGLGTSLLPMLLGSSQASIVSVLMKLLGLGDKSVLGLLGSLAPIVMGVVGKQAKSAGGFDASILTNLLGGQNNFLSSALPNELKGVMGLADLGKAASDAVSGAARTATQTAQKTVAQAAPASNPLGWLLPLLALAALGFLAWNFGLFGGGKKAEPAKTATNPGVVAPKTATVDTPAPALPEMPELPKLELPGGISIDDLKTKLTGSFDGIADILGSIKDVDTANAAKSKLEEATKAYAELGMDKMPEAANSVFGPFLKPYFGKVGELLNTIYAIPGVKEIVEPIIGPMVSSVAKLVG
ncbi:MAG: DUF937 domain-containing protein [Planctomycetaceae bacterium]|jgi:hypothetical protein|nr:DUF937 domain-containing protein [Planctomycetaceae bacterium]